MPVVGEQKDRLGDLIEELIERFDEHLATPPEPPVVKVEPAPPVIHVNPTSVTMPAPIVNVAPATPAKGSWLFTVSRNHDGLIETITVDPK